MILTLNISFLLEGGEWLTLDLTCSRENISELPNLSVKHWTVKNEECLSLIKKKYLPGIPLGIIESSAF